MTSTNHSLPDGFDVFRDTDGDWQLSVPENVIVFSAPGEGLLLSAETFEEAITEAREAIRTCQYI